MLNNNDDNKRYVGVKRPPKPLKPQVILPRRARAQAYAAAQAALGPPIDQAQQLVQCQQTIEQAAAFLVASGKSPKILVKVAKNLGDSLHGQVIIRHYRQLHPNACIVFLTEEGYYNVHELNRDIDKTFLLPRKLTPQSRLAMWDIIKNNPAVDISIIPAINPFRAVHKENDWSTNNIADQYLRNAGIVGEPLGGRRIEIAIDESDRMFAAKALAGLNRDKLIVFEYMSYSTPPVWDRAHYARFVKAAARLGFKCVSLAGAQEPVIPGAIDMRGTTWRQAAALIGSADRFVGCGSGMSMLAVGSNPKPIIFEIDVPENVTLEGCGYAKATVIRKLSPEQAAPMICR